MKIKTGDKTYEGPDEFGKKYKDMVKKMESYKDLDEQLQDAMSKIRDLEEMKEKDEAKKKAKNMAMDEKSKLIAQVDELEKILASLSKKDEEKDELKKQVKELVSAQSVARNFLKDSDKIEDLEILELKKAVIKADSPDIQESKLDNDDYVNARFDLIAERKNQTQNRDEKIGKTILDGRNDRSEEGSNEINKDSTVTNAHDAMLASIDSYKDEMNKRMEALQP